MTPYRSPVSLCNEREADMIKTYSEFIYVIGCASSLMATGILGQYFSRDLPENHASGSSIGFVCGFLILAVYCACKAIAIMTKSKS